MGSYDGFLKSKVKMAEQFGFDVADSDVNPILKPHQREDKAATRNYLASTK